MALPDLVYRWVSADGPDVAESQAAILENHACQMHLTWRMVAPGRTQAAVLSQWGLGRGAIPPVALQETRSRGCLRAKSLWPFVLSLSRLLAHRRPKKSFTLTRRYQSSRPIPVSTSNIIRRACGLCRTGPAFFSEMRFAARRAWVSVPQGVTRPAVDAGATADIFAAATMFPVSRHNPYNYSWHLSRMRRFSIALPRCHLFYPVTSKIQNAPSWTMAAHGPIWSKSRHRSATVFYNSGSLPAGPIPVCCAESRYRSTLKGSALC